MIRLTLEINEHKKLENAETSNDNEYIRPAIKSQSIGGVL